MNPKSFPNTRGALSEDEPEAVYMSIDSPDSPEEAGANARSPSLDPDYEPEEEADMLLDQAAIEVKMDSQEYIAPGSRSPSLLRHFSTRYTGQGRTPTPRRATRRRAEREGRRRVGGDPGRGFSWIKSRAALSRKKGALASKRPTGPGEEVESGQRGMGVYLQTLQTVPRQGVRRQLAHEGGGPEKGE